MARPPPSENRNLIEVAKQHLDFPTTVKDEHTLKTYIEELKKHVEQYPNDINFRIKLQPKAGFGIVICSESGCKNEQIKLVKRNSARDGGKSIGLGSLSSYRVHIANTPLHVQSRDARMSKREAGPVKTESGRKSLSLSPEKRAAILHTLPGAFPYRVSAAPSTASNKTSTDRSHNDSVPRASLNSIKSEPAEHSLQQLVRKRRSSLSLNVLKSEENPHISLSCIAPPPTKAIKTEHKTDIATHTLLTDISRPIQAHVKPKLEDMESTEDTRSKLVEVQYELLRVKRELVKAEDKRHKTKGDETRIARLTKQRDELQLAKNKLNVALPPTTIQNDAFYAAQSGLTSSRMQLPPLFHHPSTASNVPPRLQLQQLFASGSQMTQQSLAMVLDGEEYHTGPYAHHQISPRATLLGKAVDEDAWDDNGHWYGRGKDRFIGPVAKADDINQFLIAAGNAEKFDANDSVHKGLQKLGLSGLFQPLPGMEVALMPHQVIGVAWMVDKEDNRIFKGGVLADDMGLGKTVQIIALMTKNRPSGTETKSTLIVAPVALLDQWQYEIEVKTNMNLRCLIYHGNGKPKRLDQLQKYDIVLTTYQTLALEWPDDQAVEREQKRKKRKSKGGQSFIVDDSSEEERMAQKRKARQAPGLLFAMKVCDISFRVILDEAQNIRNRRTRVSRAVSKLNSEYRWCLTGTPIVNSLVDAYPLLRFLQIRPWYDWQEFNNRIARFEKKQPYVATRNLQVIFTSMLLRRKKDSLLDGKPLIDLPSKVVELCKLEFSQEERDIYKMVETRSQAIFNRYLRAGTVLKNYYQVLVMLLRLRQVCSHASLITEEGVALVRPGEEADTGDRNAQLLRVVEMAGPEFVAKMRSKFKEIALARMAAEAASADATLEGDDLECPICFDNYVNPIITSCGHSFCKDCIVNVINSFQPDEANEVKHPQCPTCRGTISKTGIFSRTLFEPSEVELKEKDEAIQIAPKPVVGRLIRKRKASRRRLIDSDEESTDDTDDNVSDFIVESDESEEEKDARREPKRRLSNAKGNRAARQIVLDSEDEYDEDIIHGAKPHVEATPEQIALLPKFLPSTKMKFMMESLRKIAEAHPDEKVLIISQWTQCLELVSNYLTENGFLHVKYQGDMNRNKRSQAVRVFMAKDKATIMLMSLKCGGVGLNLTRANHVISLDLGWNVAVEQQAYDRVHRLGQNRQVYVQRLVIADTVEDRILALQERKKILADASLGDGKKGKLGSLSVEELANLFGLDAAGNTIASR